MLGKYIEQLCMGGGSPQGAREKKVKVESRKNVLDERSWASRGVKVRVQAGTYSGGRGPRASKMKRGLSCDEDRLGLKTGLPSLRRLEGVQGSVAIISCTSKNQSVARNQEKRLKGVRA